MEYTAEITLHTKRPLTEDTLFDVAELGGVAVGRVGDRRVELTFSVKARDVTTAFEQAIGQATTRIDGTVVAIEIITTEEADRRAAEGLAGVGEVAKVLKVSKQRASTISKREDFPAPITRLSTGPVWRKSSVVAFDQSWNRAPGRPKKSETYVDLIFTPGNHDVNLKSDRADVRTKHGRSKPKSSWADTMKEALESKRPAGGLPEQPKMRSSNARKHDEKA